MANTDSSRRFFSASIEDSMDALYGVALRMAGTPADAEDLVADAVAKAWTAFATLDDRSRFRPWIFRILRNCFISDYRKKSIRPVESAYREQIGDDEDDGLAALLNQQSDEFLNWWAEPEHEFFNDILGEAIMSAIDRLPDAFRMTVLLINVEGLTYDEAAEALGVPCGTIRSRMKRGRTLLQKALWRQAIDAGLAIEDDRQGSTDE
jgi:RNA polymerase sigma-70 factor (ECF subfamily)